LHGRGTRAVTQRAVLDREDDVGRVTRLGGEALGEQVVRGLRLGAGRGELVGELAAVGGEHAQGHENGDDGEERALPVMGGGAGEAPEEEGHGTTLEHTECVIAITASLPCVKDHTVCCCGMATDESKASCSLTGLRERKKQRTREAIIDAALRLFAERGFERTTVADIAEAADIAPRTFFGYFPTKEDVVFHDFDAVFAGLERRLSAREPGETAIDAMREWIAALMAEADFDDPRERKQRELIRSTPALREYDRSLMARFEVALGDAVAADLGADQGPLRPRMVAAAATAALSMLEAFYDDKVELLAREADPMAMVDEAMTFLRGGIEALRERTPAPVPVRPS
jgi:AcrR family transcriptional regulator